MEEAASAFHELGFGIENVLGEDQFGREGEVWCYGQRTWDAQHSVLCKGLGALGVQTRGAQEALGGELEGTYPGHLRGIHDCPCSAFKISSS